ncbi:hypothetical protein ACQ4M4_18050 [Leptolyngbya sp. AN02str]|uniref:hypothetical protein n=1 Tax=Leptolyngbya sp. AN02str TaxID=3423363 RepID=UPI003D31AE3C
MQNSERKSFPVLLILLAVGVVVVLPNLGHAPQPQSAGVPISPMLQDPEAETYEWDYEVWAATPEDAQSKCRQVGDNTQLTEYISMQQITKRPTKYGDYLFRCRFRSEEIGIPYHDPLN